MHESRETWFSITRLVDQINCNRAARYVLFEAAFTFPFDIRCYEISIEVQAQEHIFPSVQMSPLQMYFS